MHLLIILPLILFLSLWFYFFSSSTDRFSTQYSFRSSMMASFCVWGLAVTLSTEAFSLFKALNFKSLLLFYIIATCTVWALIFVTKANSQPFRYSRFKFKWPRLGITDFTLLFFLLLLFLLQAFLSYVFPPNNWDSMNYHLPRVMHWMQHQSVAHYASHSPWHLLYPPFAEYAILHTYILTGGDFFAQSIQWIAMIGSCVGVSLIMREFGTSVRLQLWGSVLTATIPIGIYEAVSTQNDYVLTLWIVAATYYFLLFIRGQSAGGAIMLAIGIGLSIKTKGTAYIFLAPVILLYVGAIIKRKNFNLFKQGILIAAIAISINAYTFIINTKLYGDPIGLSVGKSAATPAFSWATVHSNAWRHLAYNMAVNHEEVNTFITSVTVGMHRIFDLDIADPKISANNDFFIPYGRLLYSENYAPSPFHIFYFITSIVVFYLNREKFNFSIYILLFVLLGGFTLFCSYLKWQYFAGRLLLPLLVLSTAFTATVWDKALISTNKSWVTFILFALLCIPIYQAAVGINKSVEKPLFNSNKNLLDIPREQLYFHERSALLQPYSELANRLAAHTDCKRIGLIVGSDDWEYPLWVMLRERGKEFTIQHSGVKNASGRLEKSADKPCLVVELNNSKNVARIRQ